MTLRGKLDILAASPNQHKLYEFFRGLVDEIEALTRERDVQKQLIIEMKAREIERFGDEPKPATELAVH